MLISTAWMAVYIAMNAAIAAVIYGIYEQKRMQAASAKRSFAGFGQSLMKIKPDWGFQPGSEPWVEEGGILPLLEIPITRVAGKSPGPRFDIETILYQPGISPPIAHGAKPLPYDSALTALVKKSLATRDRDNPHKGEGTLGIVDDKGEVHPLPYSGPIVYGHIVDDPSDQSSS